MLCKHVGAAGALFKEMHVHFKVHLHLAYDSWHAGPTEKQ